MGVHPSLYVFDNKFYLVRLVGYDLRGIVLVAFVCSFVFSFSTTSLLLNLCCFEAAVTEMMRTV